MGHVSSTTGTRNCSYLVLCSIWRIQKPNNINTESHNYAQPYRGRYKRIKVSNHLLVPWITRLIAWLVSQNVSSTCSTKSWSWTVPVRGYEMVLQTLKFRSQTSNAAKPQANLVRHDHQNNAVQTYRYNVHQVCQDTTLLLTYRDMANQSILATQTECTESNSKVAALHLA